MMSAARIRVGAALLALSSVLFALFPLVRPYFPLNPRMPAATLDAAAPLVISTAWTLAHAIATLAFVVLTCALPLLLPAPAPSAFQPRAVRGLLLMLAGIALTLPTLGVELYALPAVGRVYLAGAPGIAPIITDFYIGPMTAVLLLGLGLLAVGAIIYARACWVSRTASRWAAAVWAGGLTLWLPLLPPPIRIADGLVIGIGGTWLGWTLWREARRRDLASPPEPARASVSS